MVKKLLKDTLDITKVGMMSGVGSQALSSVGASSAGIASLSAGLPIVGSISGMGAVVRQTKRLQRSKQRRRKKTRR